jgi:hypothetical protein
MEEINVVEKSMVVQEGQVEGTTDAVLDVTSFSVGDTEDDFTVTSFIWSNL